MIRLLEHEGKSLLASHGIAVPEGGLYRALPAALDGALVVKAQVAAGGRGKAGGIRFAPDRATALALAADMQGMHLNGETVADIYIERRLAVAQEFYLAALVDRDRGLPVLLASAEGGIDIEQLASDRLLHQPIDPLIGLRPFMAARLARGLGLAGATATDFIDIAMRLAIALVAEDAELLEINPLVLTTEGRFVAADAKAALDEDAAFRHAGRRATPAGTAFETAARALGTVGVEIGAPGGVAAIMNGAGLTMATLDELVALGAPVCGVVELHGATAHGPERIADIIGCVLDTLAPAVILINIHFQFRSLKTIADGVLLARARFPALTPGRLVLRLRGEREAEGRALLAPAGLSIIAGFGPACIAAAACAGP